ncbi:UPF0262 family protein [Thalassospira marina]|uniref:UPF0262 protein COO20_16395 n=1 Tax=Thalassospira marina TaxID=2048283 RepID=A0A2N3KRV0_9PROT|nr:UPF0262 family protein [Thalassospira marina]AUG55122.1 hypothetical protein CSC3H3_14005 [Thalassospira marina]PKR53265.1 hypothetical protein COO20_16395 [Thalassospira marina]
MADAVNNQCIAGIYLDQKYKIRRRPEVEHEQAVAIYDLLEENHFAPVGDFVGPYSVHMRIEDNRIYMDVRGDNDDENLTTIVLPLTPFRRIVKDYFMICESYYDAIKKASAAQIETIDMARRGLHNEGSEQLRDLLSEKVVIDENTARRLFTLICVLHIRG